jgi:hypothetical protein
MRLKTADSVEAVWWRQVVRAKCAGVRAKARPLRTLVGGDIPARTLTFPRAADSNTQYDEVDTAGRAGTSAHGRDRAVVGEAV